MRLVQAFGLAVLAIVAAMMFIGASTASAEDKEVVLCKQEQLLCQKDLIWPEKLLTGLAKGITFLGAPEVACTHSELHGDTKVEMGDPLLFNITVWTFTGCAKSCLKVTAESLPYDASFRVEAKDHYFLLTNFKIKMSECSLGATCVYGAGDLVFNIENTLKGTQLVSASEIPLKREEGTEAFCGESVALDACYALENPNLYLWFSLFQLPF